jgi:hypothetical protein
MTGGKSTGAHLPSPWFHEQLAQPHGKPEVGMSIARTGNALGRLDSPEGKNSEKIGTRRVAGQK